ncbi:MAG TPA: hypothetical protein PLJ97_03055, partial [Candidatus Saccharibacteria bacterium]|nr:hypothetical protein [Candidatus Saccharibacteria bacterium]
YFDSHFILASRRQIQIYNYAGNSAAYGRIYVPSNENLTFEVNGSDRLSINSAGNVGIGTTNPAQRLHVVGTSYLNGQITTSLSGTGNRCVYVDSSGNLLAKSTDCGTATGGDNLGNHIATQNIQLGNYWLSGDGGAEGVFVTAAGNVGVGTSAPAQRLHVNGSVQATSFIGALSGNASTATALAENGANCSAGYYPLGVNAYGAAENCTLLPTGGASLPSGSSGQTLRHDGSNWITNSNIFNNGTNVGIGTTNPGYKLDIAGNVNIAGALYISSADFQLMPQLYLSYEDNAVKYASDYNTVFTRNSYRHLSFDHPQENYNVVYFQSATNPDVSNNEWGSLGHDSTNFLIKTGANTGTGSAPTTRENAIVFAPRGTEQMRITGNGNVGIGTTAPTQKLHVNGHVRATNFYGAFVGNASTASALAADGTNCAAGSYPRGVDAAGNAQDCTVAGALPSGTASYTLRHNGTTWVSNSNIYNNGTNVGIGTTAPSRKLHVVGTS